MAANTNAPRDKNFVTALLGTSSADGITPVVLWADQTTHRLLVDASSGVPNFADGEIPGGAVNGSNVTFTLAHTPSPALSLELFVNGQLLSPVGVDYTLVTATITLNTAPPTNSVIICWYRF